MQEKKQYVWSFSLTPTHPLIEPSKSPAYVCWPELQYGWVKSYKINKESIAAVEIQSEIRFKAQTGWTHAWVETVLLCLKIQDQSQAGDSTTRFIFRSESTIHWRRGREEVKDSSHSRRNKWHVSEESWNQFLNTQ